MIKKLLLVLGILLTSIILLVVFKKNKLEKIVEQNPVIYNCAQLVKSFKPAAKDREKTPEAKGAVRRELTITVNANKSLGPFEQFYDGIGMGTFHDGLIVPHNYAFFKLLGDMNQQQRIMNYVNMKCIFMDPPKRGLYDYGAHVYQVNQAGKVSYYWGIVDAVIDRILKNDLKPIISLTFMPEAIASDPSQKNPWNRGIISPPKDYRQWRELIFQTIQHLKQRYGAKEIGTWYFEVWNEPDLYRWFWQVHPDKKNFPKRSDFDEYCKLYDYAVDGALAAESKIKIGGPAIAGDKLFLTKFLEHCFQGKNNVTGEIGSRLDFVSRHHYGEIEERIIPNYQEFIQRIKQAAGNAFPALDILITETGPSTHPKPWLNKRYVASWIIKEVDAFYHLADKFGADYLPDIVCFWTKPVSMNFGDQFSLVTALGDKHRPDPATLLKRPAFNGFQVVNMLGQERIELTGSNFGDPVHGIATRTGEASIEVALYHFIEGDTYNNLKNDYNIQLQVTGCMQSEYVFEYYRIDEKFSNSYNLWKKIGSPEYPSPEQLRILQENDDLTLFEPVTKVATPNGRFRTEITLHTNNVAFVRLRQTSDTSPPPPPKQLETHLDWEVRAVRLKWLPAGTADSGNRAVSYQVFRNGQRLTHQFQQTYIDSLFEDDSRYQYAVFAVDNAGNASHQAAEQTVHIPADTQAPQIKRLELPNEETLVIVVDEPLVPPAAENPENFSVDGLEIKQVVYDQHERTLTLKTTRHTPNQEYRLTIKNVTDLARSPNQLAVINYPYQYELTYVDHFDINTLDNYTWTHVEGPAKEIRRIYEARSKRMLVLVGDDNRNAFSHRLPGARKGHFSIQFVPVTKYPSGGAITVYLKEDDANFYKISNTDGYGPGAIEKVVAGNVVGKVSFTEQYHQKRPYVLSLDFRPGSLLVNAFNENLELRNDNHQIFVNQFTIELTQQDAYLDDIEFEGE